MKKICLVFACSCLSVYSMYAQVGIGTDTPNTHAVLELRSPNSNQGLILPSLTTAQRTSAAFTGQLSASENGLLVFDSEENKFYFWQNNTWQILVSGAVAGGATGPASGDLTGSYPAPQIAAGVVGSPELANNAVITTKLADAGVTTIKLADNSITSVKIADGTVSSADITDATITNADISATAAIVDTKLATIATPGKVSGAAITSGTISGTTAINISGNILTSGRIFAANTTTSGVVTVVNNSTTGGYAIAGSSASTNGGGAIYGTGTGMTVGRTTTYSYGVYGANSFGNSFGWIGGNEGVHGESTGTGVTGNGSYGVTGEGTFIGVFGTAPAISGNYGVYSSGQAGGTTTWAATSDQRFKKNIQPLSNSLENVLKLRGVSYDWRTDEFPKKNFKSDRDIGVIAQEVLNVVPEVVVKDREGYYSVSYEKMVPLLIEAIKELEQKIVVLEQQNKEVSDIKARLEAIEKMVSAKAPESARTDR